MEPTNPHAATLEQVVFEIKKVIVGQDRAIERMLVCLLAGGHCLLESVPGLAKTLAVETMASTVGGTFSRIQFTPDLMPSDISGTRIYRASSETFDIELGPVFVNFLLADEINRAPAKVQSALLEVMAEHQVSLAGITHELPSPFIVLATQNPIESEGVYPLPEAQRDRFMMKVLIDYPSPAEEVAIVERMGKIPPTASQVISPEQVLEMQAAARDLYIDRGVMEYAINLVLATRMPANFGMAELDDLIEYGASPRASLALVKAGRALALMRGRNYVIPQDIFDVAPEILRHRIVLTYQALADNITSEHVLARLLGTVPAPRVSPVQQPMPNDAAFGASGSGSNNPQTGWVAPSEAPSPAAGWN